MKKMDKKTALYDKHLELGGKIVPFGGFLLPVQYAGGGLVNEHLIVRKAVGLFDVSHMGEVFFEGEHALAHVQKLFTNDFSTMKDGQIRYTLMCHEDGGIVDDMIVYKFNDQKFMAVVNAGNHDKDVDWMADRLGGAGQFIDRSDDIGLLALQGPKSKEVLKKLIPETDIPEKYYTFKEHVVIDGMPILLSQTGYTGEHGYELYTDAADVGRIWDLLLEAGAEFGILPCGLGARDTLRLEAGMPLYGHEMTDSITPFEAGLKFAVKLKKDDFIGKAALAAKTEPETVRVGLKVTGRGIIREDAKLYVGDEEVGYSTSGTHAPYLGYAIAMGMVAKDYSEIGTALEAEVRGRRIPAEIVALPFYKK